MGRIRTKDIKDLARDLHSVYPDRFTVDFEQNKAVMGELKIVEGKSKRFRNRVAGYIVCLARQVARGHHPSGERAPEGDEAETIEEVETEEAEAPEAEETETKDEQAKATEEKAE